MQDVPLEQRFDAENFLGEDVDDQTYTKMPVADYGIAMLQQMGWSEQRGIGKNTQNQLVRPIEFVPRHYRQGLGADPVPLPGKGSNGANGSNGQPPKILVSKTGKNYNYIGDQLVEKRKYLLKNDRVFIKDGQHHGLQGTAVSVNEEEGECFVELENEEVVRCKIEHVLPHYLKNTQSYQEGNNNNDGDDDENLKILAKSKKIKKDKKENKKHRLRWVQPQARVRIVSKDYRSGRFYNTKVVVQDILDKYHFSALTPKGEILDDLEEEHVETVIPELEKRVVVLQPKDRRGAIAILKQRNKKQNEIVVQLEDDLQLFKCTQDDVAEYCAQ